MAKEGGPEKVVSELSKWESMQPHILLAWMNCAHDIIEKVDLEKLGQLGQISLAIIRYVFIYASQFLNVFSRMVIDSLSLIFA